MRKTDYLIIIFLSFLEIVLAQEKSANYRIRTLAFYNLENLYDTINDPKKFDDERTPDGKDTYTWAVYRDKIDKLAKVLNGIGREETKDSPAIIGVCEIENRQVLEDLVASKHLKDKNYQIIHQDSPDERGIDVALLFQPAYFKAISYRVYELFIYTKNKKRDHTRDQLLVNGALDNELIYIIVNHWPSRSGGIARSQANRIAAAALTRKIIDSIQVNDTLAKIIVMGDFNDDPDNKSISEILKAKSRKRLLKKSTQLFNPMAAERNYGYRFYKAGIYNKHFLINKRGIYKGYPFRSYHNNTYQAGYSDHFPVYINLIRKKE